MFIYKQQLESIPF